MELYYYTTTQTLQFILQKGNIYATNIRYMNDSEEYTNGLQEIYKLVEKDDILKEWSRLRDIPIDRNEIRNVFTERSLNECMMDLEYYSISFCKKNDLLSQWAIYARESGVSIRMNFEDREYVFSTFAEENVNTDRVKWRTRPREVHYFTYDSMSNDRELYRDESFKILDKLLVKQKRTDYIEQMEKWKNIATYIKRFDFYQEAESRIVFDPKLASGSPRIDYRNDKKVIKPYIDIECQNGWPVWGVMVGPGFNQEIVFNSIKHLLDHSAVQNQIKETRQYAERIAEYFRPYDKEIENDDYKKMKKEIDAVKSGKTKSLKDAKIEYFALVKSIVRDIVKDKKYKEEIREYFSGNYFSRTGIIVSKSSIPYIF